MGASTTEMVIGPVQHLDIQFRMPYTKSQQPNKKTVAVIKRQRWASRDING
jgi:hypothetical protein